jgi:hypothetical protein
MLATILYSSIPMRCFPYRMMFTTEKTRSSPVMARPYTFPLLCT